MGYDKIMEMFGKRLVALLIDWMIVFTALIIIGSFGKITGLYSSQIFEFRGNYIDQMIVFFLWISICVGISLRPSHWGQTLGKQVMKIQVGHTDEILGLTLREIFRILPLCVFMVNQSLLGPAFFVWICVNLFLALKTNSSTHDKIAQTTVEEKRFPSLPNLMPEDAS